MRFELVKRRKLKKKNQQEMGEILGVSKTTYQTIERGETDPRFSQVAKLLEYFGMDEKDGNELMKNE
jgi:transcriptional regulator with XRE-family HTH domain